VYRIDLSQVVSKYIGETEKNLEKVFNQSQHRDWILFFDEADALFGKRSNIQSSHDRYANQEIAYLLQRITDYPGLIILASNYKNNIDAAFTRRFNTVVHFPLPDARQRLLLWQKAVPRNFTLGFDLAEVADRYEITGAGIVNVIHYATLKAMAAGQKCIQLADIRRGIQEEFHKEDKFF
jgi:SpoVK/Ycf46/Vps4 family AAA+-type ATPase